MSKLLKCYIKEAWTLFALVSQRTLRSFVKVKVTGVRVNCIREKENVRKWRRHSREDLRKKKNKEKGRFLKNMWIQGTVSCFDFCLIFMIGNNRAVFLTFDHLLEPAGDF